MSEGCDYIQKREDACDHWLQIYPPPLDQTYELVFVYTCDLRIDLHLRINRYAIPIDPRIRIRVLFNRPIKRLLRSLLNHPLIHTF